MSIDDTPPRSGTGEPTVTLKETEYREWVQSRIAGTMIRWITGVGLTALALGFSALAIFIGMFVENAKKDVSEELEDRLSEELKRQVATTIIEFPDLQKAIIENTEKTIGEATDPNALSEKIINDPSLLTKIVSQVKQEITKVGGLNDYLVKELEEFATNPDLELEPDQRAPALQLLVMFERSPTRVKEILGDVLEEDDWLGTEVYEVALNFYPHQQPGASAGDPGREEKLQQLDMKALEVVLEHLQSPEWPQALAPDYARFLGRFQPRYADRLAAWLK